MDLIIRFVSLAVIAAAAFSTACNRHAEAPSPAPPPDKTKPAATLHEARRSFETQLTKKESEDYPTPEPPSEMFDLVEYEGPLGQMDAYIGKAPFSGEKHPAIIWLSGGFSNSIHEGAWNPGERDNDQSASAFRKAGIVMMYPSRRGGNQSPGTKEGLFGEVDDVIAAATHLASINYVDPDRIYLGGHSVGGTLALLVAESSTAFRAVFSLGPVERTSYYGEESLPFNVYAAEEDRLRAPIEWLHCITCPTFIIEGGDGGNSDSVEAMGSKSDNPLVNTFIISDKDHFNIIRPVSELIAGKILADSGSGGSQVSITDKELETFTSRVLAPPRAPFPGGSPLSSLAECEFAIYYPAMPKGDPMKALKDSLAESFPDFELVDVLEPNPISPQISANLILGEDVAATYRPPDLESLKYFSKGLDQTQQEKLQACQQVLVIRFRHPGKQSIPVLHDANQLLSKMADQTAGFIWDEETREIFSVPAWDETRNANWSDGLPLVSDQVAVHAYRDGEYVRAISLGMKKFGAPDVVVDQFATSGNKSIGNLLNHFCQAVVEGAAFEANGYFDLKLKNIHHDRMRKRAEESASENATGIAELAIKAAPWEEGDPVNALMEISFERADGVDLFAQQDSVTSSYFGSHDQVTAVARNEQIEAASDRARAKLPELQKAFQAGLAPGGQLLLKAPFGTADDSIEWMWVEVTHWNDESIRGLLQNDPHNVPGLQSGQEVTIKEDDVFDYIRQFTDGRRDGNETGEIIRKLQGE